MFSSSFSSEQGQRILLFSHKNSWLRFYLVQEVVWSYQSEFALLEFLSDIYTVHVLWGIWFRLVLIGFHGLTPDIECNLCSWTASFSFMLSVKYPVCLSLSSLFQGCTMESKNRSRCDWLSDFSWRTVNFLHSY